MRPTATALALTMLFATASAAPSARAGGVASSLSKFRDMVRQSKLERLRKNLDEVNVNLKQKMQPPTTTDWKDAAAGYDGNEEAQQLAPVGQLRQMNAPADTPMPRPSMVAPPRPSVLAKPAPRPAASTRLQVLLPYEKTPLAEGQGMVLVDERGLKGLEHEKPRPPKEPVPPVEVLFETLSLHASVEGDSARVRLRLSLRTFADGWATVPLNLGDAVLAKLELDGKAASAVAPDVARKALSELFPGSPARKPIALLVGKAGSHVIEAEYLLAPSLRNGRHGLFLALPRAVSTEVTAELPGTGLRIEAPGAIAEERSERSGRTRFVCSLPPRDSLQLGWAEAGETRRVVRPRPVAVTGEVELDPVVNVESLSVFEWERGILGTRFHLHYRVFRKAVDRLRFSFPASLDLLEIRDPEGKVTRSYRKEESQGRKIVELFLPAPKKGEFTVSATMDRDCRSFRKKAGAVALTRFALPLCRPENVDGAGGHELQRHEAYLSASIHDELRTKIALQEGVSPLPRNKLPQALRALVPAKAWGIFRCVGEDWRLGLSLNERARAETTAYEIARAELVTVLTDQRKALTRIRYQVKNSKRQFMKLILPEGSRVQSVFVGNKPVKPGLEDPADPEKLLVALERSQSSRTVDELAPFPVELTYVGPAPSLSPWGRLELAMARAEAQVREISWRIYLPDGHHFTGIGGDFRDDPTESSATSGAYLQLDGASTRSTSGWDKGGFMSQVQSMSNVYRPISLGDRGAGAPSGEERDGDGTAKRGRFPVRIEPVPTSAGRAFRCGVVPEDETRLRRVRLFYARAGLVAKAGHVFCVLVAFFTLLFFVRLGRKERVVLPLAGLVIGLVGALALDDGFPALRLAEDGLQPALAIGVGLAMVYGLCTPLRRRAARRAAAAGLALFLVASAAGAADGVLVPYPEKQLGSTLRRDSVPALVPRSMIEERERIEKELEARRVKETEEKEARPPVAVLFSEVRCDGEILDERARLTVDLVLDVLQDDWQRLDLVTGDLALDRVTIDDEPALVTVAEDAGFLDAEMRQNRIIVADMERNAEALPVTRVARKTRFLLNLKGKGRHRVRLEAVATVESPGDGSHRFALDLPPAPLREMRLVMTGRRLGVQVQGAVRTHGEEKDERTEVSARLAARGELAVSWYRKAEVTPRAAVVPGPEKASTGATPTRRDAPTAAPVEAKTPWVDAELFNRATLTETSLDCTVAARLQVSRHGISTIHMAVPAAFDVLELRDGSGQPRPFRVLKTDDGAKLVEVTLPAKSTLGTVEVVMTGQLRRQGASLATVDVPRIRLMGVAHQRGWVAVEREGTMEVETRSAEGLRALAPERIPADWRRTVRSDRLYRLFGYENAPWQLQVAVRKHDDLVPVQAVIDRATALTEIASGGTGSTVLDLTVRNVSRDALRVKLPDGVKRLDAAAVRGKAVRPVQGDGGWLEIPLERPDGDGDGTAPFPVRLRWNVRTPTWGMKGRFRLAMPSLDLPVMGEGFRWTLRCADGDRYRLARFAGDFEWRRRRETFCPVGFLAPVAEGGRDYELLRRLNPWFDGPADAVWRSSPSVEVCYASRSLDFGVLLLVVFAGLVVAFATLALVAGGKGAMARVGWSRGKLLALVLAALVGFALLECFLPGQSRRLKFGLVAGTVLFFVSVVRWRLKGVFAPDGSLSPEGGDRA